MLLCAGTLELATSKVTLTFDFTVCSFELSGSLVIVLTSIPSPGESTFTPPQSPSSSSHGAFGLAPEPSPDSEVESGS